MAARGAKKKLAGRVTVRIGGESFSVSPEMKAEVASLSAGLRKNLRVPKEKLMTRAELNKLKIAEKTYSTVMCPW